MRSGPQDQVLLISTRLPISGSKQHEDENEEDFNDDDPLMFAKPFGLSDRSSLKQVVLPGHIYRFVQGSSGSSFVLLLDENGTMYGYSLDFSKRSNIPNATNWSMIDFSEPVEQIACGMRFYVFKTRSGVVYSAGNNECGQRGVGQGASGDILPVKFTTGVDGSSVMKSVVKISCGYQHTILLTSDGKLYGAGCSYQSQLGKVSGDITYLFCPLESPSFSSNYGKIIDVQTLYFSSICLTDKGFCFVAGALNYNQIIEANNWTLVPSTILSTPIRSIYASCNSVFFIGENCVYTTTSSKNYLESSDQVNTHETSTVCSIPFLKNKNIQKIFGKELFHFISDHNVYICHNPGEDISASQLMGIDHPPINTDTSFQKPVWLEVLPLSKILWSHDLTILNAFSFVMYLCDKKVSMEIVENLSNIYQYQYNTTNDEENPKHVFYDVDVLF
ncbi:hypothetical protein C9374_014043 [Naegleria lovaniensis]|uniref:Uncharacterized protein n=1 Tax=Naegleria lovaniensis TaxID=51637 RepID=A0AA88KPI2_NAELO|nr:uncharacterized protein C9374_014043 [Naegleria lovaniensis]KAG2389483.1 hypothetical protein C9374_014043 [Naegleria lovaniensis]